MTTESVTVSWTAPEPPPTRYNLTADCMLLCGDPLPPPDIPILTKQSTIATLSNIPPGSECDITFTALYGKASSNELMVAATTLSESEQLVCVREKVL